MAQKHDETKQIGARIRKSVKQRALDFCIRHPMQPSLGNVIEQALTDWLDKHERELPAPRRPKP